MILSTNVKASSLGIGAAVGLGTAIGARSLLPSPERERELEAEGIHTFSHREATATMAPVAFVTAAAVGAGLGKRSDHAALTTVSLGAAAMLASTGASAMINADGESADEYLRTLGLMSAAATLGFSIGAPTRVPEHVAKAIGLGLIGAAGGALAPETFGFLARIPGELQTSYEHRDG